MSQVVERMPGDVNDVTLATKMRPSGGSTGSLHMKFEPHPVLVGTMKPAKGANENTLASTSGEKIK